jgi:hypothetical protein
MGVTATQDSTSEWRELGAQVSTSALSSNRQAWLRSRLVAMAEGDITFYVLLGS